jgi:hypothetical protein
MESQMTAVLNLASRVETAARHTRMAIADAKQRQQAQDFALALQLIRASLRTEAQLVLLLRTATSTLAEKTYNFAHTDIGDSIGLIDEVADQIEFRYAA